MKSQALKTSLVIIVVVSIVFGPLSNVFVKKAEAGSFGATVGQAVGAGLACFGASYAESYLFSEVQEWVETIFAVKSPEGVSAEANLVLAVPVLDMTTALATKSADTRQRVNANIIKSKDCVRDVVAKIIIDWIVDQTIQWVQGGGEPKFVTDWGTFASDAFNAGVGEVVNDSNFAFLCSPFRLQVNLSLTQQTFPQRIECTLDQIVENIDDFYNDFSKGGWIAYNEIWQPQNNYYGQMLMFHDEALLRGAAAQQAALNEAQAGKGFLSVKECVEYDQDYINQCNAAGGTDCEKAAAACNKYRIVTPGDVVGRVVGEAVTSDLRWAENIQSWIAALINAVINRLVKEGVAYMKTTDEPGPAGGDFDPTNNGELTKTDYTASDLSAISRNQAANIAENYQKILDDRNAILISKQQSLSYVQDTIKAYNDTRTKGCFVKQSDIDAANAAATKLSGDISALQSVINEAKANLAEAQSLSDESSEEQRQAVIKKYTDFITSKYPSVLGEAYSGSAKKAAEDEANTWKSALDKAQAALNSCSPQNP